MTGESYSTGVSDGISALVQDLFRGGPCPWPPGFAEREETDFLRFTHDAGLQPLIHELLRLSEVWDDWPHNVRAGLEQETHRRVTIDLRRRDELERLLAGWQVAGVRPLLFKGVPLAYQVYPAPHLRPCIDTDILVPREAMSVVSDELLKQGYTKVASMDGELVLQQNSFVRRATDGVEHCIDVHWAVSYRQLFAKLFPYDELAAEAVAVPALGPYARAVSLPHALELACLHRVGHHRGSLRLAWLYDLHLLLQEMTEAQVQHAAMQIQAHRMCALCADGLARAHDLFGDDKTGRLADALRAMAATSPREPSALYLDADRGRWKEFWMDFQALPGWRERAQLLKEVALPSEAYMRAQFPEKGHVPLGRLYVRRGWRGIRKRFGATQGNAEHRS